MAMRLLLPIAYAFSVYNDFDFAKVGYVFDVGILAGSVVEFARALLGGVGKEDAFHYVATDVASRALTVAVCTLGSTPAVLVGLALLLFERACAGYLESLKDESAKPNQFQRGCRLSITAFDLASLRCIPFLMLWLLPAMKYCFGRFIMTMESLPEMLR